MNTPQNDVASAADNEVELKSENPAHSRLALKHGAHFLVLSPDGMMPHQKSAGYGLYCDDTRYLQRWELALNGSPLRLLSSDTAKGFGATFVYGNNTAHGVAEQTILVTRQIVIAEERVHERITLKNFGVTAAKLTLHILHDADFVDMFEVRGSKRPQRGEKQTATVSCDQRSLMLSYRGLDGKVMQTGIFYQSTAPKTLSASSARFDTTLAPGAEQTVDICICTSLEGSSAQPAADTLASFDDAWQNAERSYLLWRASGATITTADDQLNRMLERAYRDLYMLRQPTPRGNCLAAGLPWFAVAFGRDQCITAMQTLPFLPDLAREVITILARYQGTQDDVWTAQNVGKIMHELRLGEMARLREIPFIPFFGTVDATQLWLMLLSRYVAWTDDLDFARSMWKYARRAMRYLESATATSGFIRYGEHASALSNQGWKDSGDSVMHADGQQAKPPIAICEAQGYLYEAWSGMSVLAERLGYRRFNRTLARRAETLKQKFAREFWMPEQQFIALAIDGEGRQCQVISSNPAHLLDTDILLPEHRQAVAQRLAKPDMFSGWGIRTLSSGERAYNPMSYHNGSIWPHDNAIAVSGLCRSGQMPLAQAVVRAMIDASHLDKDARLPELFCGFDRRQSPETPIAYPVSCVPQAWAAGSIFQMLAATLGLRADARRQELRIDNPALPSWLPSITINGLRVGEATLDLHFNNAPGDRAACAVLNRAGRAHVIVA